LYLYHPSYVYLLMIYQDLYHYFSILSYHAVWAGSHHKIKQKYIVLNNDKVDY